MNNSNPYFKNRGKITRYDPAVWGVYYWFVLHSIAYFYPETPNSITKRKYYDFIQNYGMMMPDVDMGNAFSQLVDYYPVSPYLDSRESFMRWVNFIHNKINVSLGKEELSIWKSIEAYENKYEIKPSFEYNTFMTKKKWLYLLMLFIVICIILWCM